MRKKKGILLIMDGLGDRPIVTLNGKTPLEVANKPNIDNLAKEGICGGIYPIKPGYPVGTDVGHLHIFGYDSSKDYRGRGPFEAYSAGIELESGDVAFRGNFATVDEDGIVIDRRAGRIRENTNLLAESLNGMILTSGTKVLVKELTEHRVAIVLRNTGLSDMITTTDPGTGEENNPYKIPKAKDATIETHKTAKDLLEFTTRAHEILKNHPVNIERAKQNLLEANIVICRGAGKKTKMVSLYDRDHIKAACVAGDQTVGGIAQFSGIDYYSDSTFTGSFDTNLKLKGQKVVELINSNEYDWVIVHVKATDLAGHDDKPLLKKEMIEKVDIMVEEVLAKIDLNEVYFSITADHSTPCELLDHSGDSVPTLIAGGDVLADDVNEFSERACRNGVLNNLTANDIYHLQLSYMGFMTKIGS